MATNRALLVAINNYGSQQNNLPSCLEDAARFRSLLEERYGFDQFTELYDGDATVANVEQGLTWLFEDVAPDDRLVFFYSGHGYQQPNGENLEECLVLGNMEFLFDDRLSELSQAAPPGVLTVVFDSCFSGGMEKQVEADGRIEIARTKAWVPPANARSQQQKSLIGQQLIPRPFGSQQVTDPAGVKALVLGRGSAPTKAGAGGATNEAGQGATGGADETGELALNGLLLSACSENETASAATSATDGMSAFTCALMSVFDAAQGELTVAELHEQAHAKLQELGFRQTPLLKAPNEPADLASMGFVTLAPAGGEAEQGQAAQGQAAQGQAAQGKSATAPTTRPAPATRPSTRPAPAATRPAPTTRPAPATRPAPTTRPAPNGAQPGAAAARPAKPSAAAGASPNAPGIAPGERPPTSPREQRETQGREQRATPPREQRATPSSANGSTPTNVTEGDSAMNTSTMTTMQPNEEKWIGLVAGVAASVLPQVINAVRNRRKDFAPEVMPAAPTGVGNGDDADAEQKWVAALARAVIPAAISAAPGLINAIRGRRKDAAVEFPATGSTGAEDAEGEEKWIGLVAGVAASVLPQVIGAVRNRRKDFAPEVMPAAPTGVGIGNGDDADAEQKWVAALARAVIPAAISAAPGLINAVRGRGKDAAVFSPATGNTESEADEKWIGLAAGVAASVLPQVIGAIRNRRKDFAPEVMPDGYTGAGNGDDAEQKWVAALARAVIPAAISAAPGLINAARGKDFVPYPAPATAGQQRSAEDFTDEDEKILRAVTPAVMAATMPAVAQAMRGGTDRRYRAAI